jgi:DNA replication and repair protein RecF
VRLVNLGCWNFRNLASGPVHWLQGTNLIVGGNGEGKTSLLEAVAVLGNLRSFRTRSLRRVVRHGQPSFCLEGEVASPHGNTLLRQVVETGPPLRRQLWANGAEIPTAEYLRLFPVFAMTPADSQLVAGEPALRRNFLDRLAFLLDADVYEQLRNFRRALRQRNAVLGQATLEQQQVWEEALATAAARVVLLRRRAAERLSGSFAALYEELRGASFPNISLSYRCDSWLDVEGSESELERQYQERFAATRERDLRMGFTVDGPHRHDLALRAEGRSVGHLLSSGQLKVVACALGLAALAEVERERSARLPVIIDDVDSQLDLDSMGRLAALIGVERQVFLSTAHGDVVTRSVSPASELWMRQGSCMHAVSGGEIA